MRRRYFFGALSGVDDDHRVAEVYVAAGLHGGVEA